MALSGATNGAVSILANNETSTPTNCLMSSDIGAKRLYLWFAIASVVLYSLLFKILRLKYTEIKEKTIHSHGVVPYVSAFAVCIAVLTYLTLAFEYFRNHNEKPFPPVIYMNIKFVFLVSVVVEYLSFLLSLYID